ncbi:MAG: HAMP domain-containing protein [Chloroflexi bacterium]|nr:HAMP domain-containing protein [Chloroflexota bacterium]
MKALLRAFYPRSLRFRIALTLTGLTAALGLVSLANAYNDITHIIGQRLQEEGLATARSLAAHSASHARANDKSGLVQMVRDTIANDEDLRYVFLVAPSGEVMVHTFEAGVPSELVAANMPGPKASESTRVLDMEGEEVLDIVVPVSGGQIGVLRLGMSQAGVQRDVVNHMRRLGLLVALGVVLSLGASLFLASLLTRPLVRLAKVAKAVGRGDFSQKVPVDAADELGDLAKSFNAMTDDLVRSQNEIHRKEEARRLLVGKLIGAQEEERKRIAREIHDEPVQALSAISMRLDLLKRRLAAELSTGGAEVEAAHREARKAIESLHRIMVELRPQALDDLGLLPAIRWYAETRLAERDIELDFHTTGSKARIEPQIETAVFRLVQEAINNVYKHSGARQARVRMEFTEGLVRGAVEDDGSGFDLEAVRSQPSGSRGLGLMGMDERASILGGKLTITSRPGAGTTVAFEIPLAPERKSDEKDQSADSG